jgi:hypothetical protein
MAFTLTNTEPVITPRVKVVFSGLIALQPGAPNTCEIGVHKFDRDHLFQVKLLIKKTNRPPLMVSLLHGPLLSDFEIGLVREFGAAPAPDFVAFARPGFDRTLQNSHLLDHQWAVNLRSKHANASLNDGAKPVVRLNTGVLYTPNLSLLGLNPRLTRANTPDDQLNHIATHLAVSIEPPAGTQVQFAGRDLGALFNLRLPRLKDRLEGQDAFYTLFFHNEPPALLTDPHDEFARYYRILDVAVNSGTTIPAPERFRLQFNPVASLDEIPCNPIIINP